MTLNFSFRTGFILGGMLCAMLIASAYALESFLHLEPCSLCLLQRYTLFGIVILFCLGAFQNCKGFGRQLYYLSVIFLNLLGITLATRHLWLQYWLPPDESVTCTAGFEKLLEMKPFLIALKEVLFHSQDCTKIDTFLNIPLSAWSLLGFAGLIFWILILWYQQIKRRI